MEVLVDGKWIPTGIRIFTQHFAATDKHFIAIRLFWHSGLTIIKCQSMAAKEKGNKMNQKKWIHIVSIDSVIDTAITLLKRGERQ